MSIEQILAVRLALLEERVMEMEGLLRSPGHKGSFSILMQDLSQGKRAEIAELLKEVLDRLRGVKKAVNTSPSINKTSRLMMGLANITFISSIEMEPERMKGYGEIPHWYRNLWDKELEPIKVLLQQLTELVEVPKDLDQFKD